VQSASTSGRSPSSPTPRDPAAGEDDQRNERYEISEQQENTCQRTEQAPSSTVLAYEYVAENGGKDRCGEHTGFDGRRDAEPPLARCGFGKRLGHGVHRGLDTTRLWPKEHIIRL
jgi:hypothetical protein